MGQDTVLIGAFYFSAIGGAIWLILKRLQASSSRTGKAPANLRPSGVGCCNCDLCDPLAFTEL